ncbi:YggT family protein [Thalassotalea euphylliae]|uniref:YggT family protein n=1 Tax=Thalassotalea euphylliae TaxID=1655234 RepID=A0A3E0TT19_9GAMM|nr:YggT family protein [Thalassotalea euphylliae]REL27806.1 YggT family protein [Thalassotalea euphylliae]
MEAVVYLLRFFFDAVVTLLILRVWLQMVQADFYNPLSQFVVKVTNPLVVPFRRLIPGIGGFDVATIVVALFFAILEWVVFQGLSTGQIDFLFAMYLGTLALIKQVGFLLFIIMLVMAIMSWVVQGYNPTMVIFQQLTEPFLRPIRRVVPVIGGLDLSILVAFLALNVVNILLTGAVPYWGGV